MMENVARIHPVTSAQGPGLQASDAATGEPIQGMTVSLRIFGLADAHEQLRRLLQRAGWSVAQ